ncbi:MAG: hypothetical protein ACM31G_02230, partial [Flavobacteriales bacterium]
MDFKRIYLSTTTYIILLIIGIGVLLFTTSMAYKQVKLSEESAEKVVRTLHIYNALGDLTTHYTKAESEEFRKELFKNEFSKDVFDSYKAEGRAIIDTLRKLTKDNTIQTLRLKPLSSLLDTLHDQLISLEMVNYPDSEAALQALELQKIKIGNTLNDIQ